jgi:hypothetical protein
MGAPAPFDYQLQYLSSLCSTVVTLKNGLKVLWSIFDCKAFRVFISSELVNIFK